MMINKRLIGTVKDSKKYIAGNVAVKWCSLVSNIVMMFTITSFFQKLYKKTAGKQDFILVAVITMAMILIRFLCTVGASKMEYMSSKAVKKILREMIYKKLLKIGVSYNEKVKTSEVVQVAVEGASQLETYFGAYLPQFFYSMLAPVTLFIVLSFVSVSSAVVLLVCVPLIPVTIAAVQTWAKKLLAKYWGQYTTLGDTFLENLQGLTTLKIYQADGFKNEEMNMESEKFRKITMKVLTMQLNSITVMDIIAYGGSALGVIMAVTRFNAGNVSMAGCLLIILLSADFFIPMRQLGSFFHIAMNGMAASDKIFKLLDLPETDGEQRTESLESRAGYRKNLAALSLDDGMDIICTNVSFSYEKDKEILHEINLYVPQGSFISMVGESGCGKSTIASILMGRRKNYTGAVKIGGNELREIEEDVLLRNITYISHNSFLFQGSVRENLAMGDRNATENDMWRVLEKTELSSFLKCEDGLDTKLEEKAANLSGGQRQRLALARAMLHDSPVYIFDEATSNIDVESENNIMKVIHELAKTKSVILISHRLANVVNSDTIYVIEKGMVVESGNHQQLLNNHGVYEKLWNAQQKLENFGVAENIGNVVKSEVKRIEEEK